MIDAQRLLDQFLGTGRARPGAPQAGGAGSALPGGLDQIIGGALGRAGGGGGLGGGLGNLGGLGGSIPPALAGGIAGYLLRGKGVKKLGEGALKVGGLALVAGLGYKAWQNYQAQQQQGGQGPATGPGPHGELARPVPAEVLPSPEGTKFLPPESEADRRARLLLSASIAAAKADGYIDQREEEAIFGRVDELQLDGEAKGLLMDELRRPRSIDDLVAEATSPEVAVEIYLASLLAVDADHPSERAYLDLLASRLGLEPALVAEIRRTAEEAQATA